MRILEWNKELKNEDVWDDLVVWGSCCRVCWFTFEYKSLYSGMGEIVFLKFFLIFISLFVVCLNYIILRNKYML